MTDEEAMKQLGIAKVMNVDFAAWNSHWTCPFNGHEGECLEWDICDPAKRPEGCMVLNGAVLVRRKP